VPDSACRRFAVAFPEHEYRQRCNYGKPPVNNRHDPHPFHYTQRREREGIPAYALLGITVPSDYHNSKVLWYNLSCLPHVTLNGLVDLS
jgi:hypothetical protein